jgi:hypothetical protein
VPYGSEETRAVAVSCEGLQSETEFAPEDGQLGRNMERFVCLFVCLFVCFISNQN